MSNLQQQIRQLERSLVASRHRLSQDANELMKHVSVKTLLVLEISVGFVFGFFLAKNKSGRELMRTSLSLFKTARQISHPLGWLATIIKNIHS